MGGGEGKVGGPSPFCNTVLLAGHFTSSLQDCIHGLFWLWWRWICLSYIKVLKVCPTCRQIQKLFF